jgi:putative endopeptidase
MRLVLQTAAAAAALAVGLDLAGMDRTVAPGDDFFRYANGTWLKTTEIPADRASYGPGAMLVEQTTKRTSEIVEEAAKAGAAGGSAAQRVGDYYASLVDQAAIDAKGLAPLRPTLDRIAAIRDRAGLSRALGETLRADVDVLNATNLYTDNLLGLWIAQDLDDPSRYATFLLQGGLDMPGREYYLDPSPRMAEIRTKYQAHVQRVLELARVPDAAGKATRIADLEHRIAEAHGPRQDDFDVKKGDNHWPRARFDELAPGLDWSACFEAAGLGRQTEFVVWQPKAVTGLSALVASQPLDAWKEYMTFHAIEHVAAVLPAAFGDERFAFHGTVLAGVPKRRELWKRAADATSAALAEDVGRLYVERWFPASSKARIEAMTEKLKAAFGRRIDALDWMAPATKARAKEKLAALKVGVGYPDQWRDYSGLRVVRGDAFGNAQRAELFELHRNLAKLGRPVDRSEWVMSPQTVNAVNLPAMNALNFPAAILQAPYFDPARPLAMDYGAIGATIGHEVSHSFDDQGSQFDAAGRLSNWWTDADRKHFEEAAARLVQQYDAYRPFPDLHVNGTLTLSENIADVAGLAAAYDAYRLSVGSDSAPEVAGLTGDQQFFLSYAQSWRDKTREPALRRQIIEDGHAPDEYRADTVRNLDPWYPAFDVKPGQALYLAPPDRVRIW